MAETVINTTVQVLVEKLIGVATQELSLILGFKNELKRLKKYLQMTQAFLHDAAKRQLEDEAVKLWLKNLEDVAYDADNLLDEFNYEIIRRKVYDIESQIFKPKKVCFFFTCNSNPLGFRSTMAHKIKDVNMKLTMVNQEASSHGLQKIVADSGLSLPLFMETDSISVDPIVIGRENDVSKIVNMLVESSINEVISVVPITGMGGLGKTTLARLVFNHEQTLKQFDERIWVCVSENFNTTNLLKRILESLSKDIVALESKEAIVKMLQEKLSTKRYLLVLDDLWNDNRKQWDDFKGSLSGINNKIGNFILVTTRSDKIASIVKSETNYILGILLDNDCWSIIKAITYKNREVPPEFATIGLEIARKCRGLPIAASMIGGALRGKKIDDWTSMKNGFSNTNTEEKEVLQVLKISFDRLPSLLLKKCFAYCSVFKKDEKLKRDRLVQLWMAEGFLIENHENDMERVGDRVFEALVQSSFFLEVEEENFLGIKCYKMHDLVHDLACFVSRTESFNAENRIPDRIPRVRYLAIKSLHEGVQNIMKDESLYLRTLFLGNNVPDNMYQDLKHLRVLDMSESKIEEVTASIDMLMHLRLLDVSSTDIKALPESICKLYHLQTLNIIDCFSLKELPNQFHRLVSLRHFITFDGPPFEMPRELGNLTCLRTLKFFNVGREKGLQIQELQYLKNLRGKICVSHLELVNGKDEAVKANLIEKPNIQELGLVWNVQLEGEEDNHVKVLEGLQPHPNLKRLYINGFNGDKFPTWTMKMTTIGEVKLNNLIEISLSECRRCEEIPTLGHLPLLETLCLERLSNLKSIGASFYYSNDCSQPTTGTTILFPALKRFTMFKLKKLVDWVGPAVAESLATTFSTCAFPRLEELEIADCWSMIIAPINDFPSLQKLRISSMNSYNVLGRLSSNKLTSLVHLSISSIWDLNWINETAFHNMPCLEYLHVESCTSLNHLGLLDDVHNLKSLTIWRCDKLSSISYSTSQSQGLSCLKILRIEYCSMLSIFPITEMLQSCTSLEDLSIRECHNLTSLAIDFNRMQHLSYVTISNLPKLTTLPKGFGSLTMLTRLEIGGFSEESGLGLLSEIVKDIQRLKNLRNLLVFGWQQWESLPDQLQYLTTLTSLEIEGFGIESLPEWIWNMSSLEYIRVANCEKLRYKPSEEAILRLTRLNLLSISYCPLIGTVQWTKWSSFS